MILAPSAALFISHQLGTMKPSHGLFLCEGIFNYMLNGEHITVPINPTLKGAEIILFHLQEGGIAINFEPKHNLFHNSNSLEEGARQLVHNYYPHVISSLKNYPLSIISAKVAISQVLGMYQRLLEVLIKENKLKPHSDKWFTEMSLTMARVNRDFSRSYNDEYQSKEEAENAISFFEENFRNFYKNHKQLTMKLGLRN